jgi:hypothetical protein
MSVLGSLKSFPVLTLPPIVSKPSPPTYSSAAS